MQRRNLLLPTVVALVVAGCGEAKLPPFQRDFRYVLSTPQWTSASIAGMDSADISDVFILDTTVVAMQTGLARLIGMDPSSGTVRWRAGRHGLGPAEFVVPNQLVILPPDRFGVIDNRAARMPIFDMRGRYVTSVSGELFKHEVHSVCPSQNEEYLAVQLHTGSIVRASRVGDVIHQSHVQWPDPKLDSAIQLSQTNFARVHERGVRCLLHTMRGQFFSEVDGTSLKLDRVQKYAEPLRLPILVRKNGQIGLLKEQTSGIFAVVNDAKLFVLFGGSSDKAEQQIDVYDQRTGLYVWSILLPRKVSRFDIQGDRIVAVERNADASVVVSYLLTTSKVSTNQISFEVANGR